MRSPGTRRSRRRSGPAPPASGSGRCDRPREQHQAPTLVELSKLGDECARIEEEIAWWLRHHDVVFADRTIPFVLMPHFVSPGQERRVRGVVACLLRVLDRFCDAYPTD